MVEDYKEKFNQKMKVLNEYLSNNLSSFASRAMEIDTGLLSKGYAPPLQPSEIPNEVSSVYFDLEKSMNRIWNEAVWCYVYGFFQASTFMIGAFTELLIEQFLRIRGWWPAYERDKPDPRHRWLGTLVGFCEKRELLSPTILGGAKEINDQRVSAVHMGAEKESSQSPPDARPLVELEDTTDRKNSEISSGLMPYGQSLIIDLSNPEKPIMKRALMYKPQAEKAFKALSTIFWSIRELESTGKKDL